MKVLVYNNIATATVEASLPQWSVRGAGHWDCSRRNTGTSSHRTNVLKHISPCSSKNQCPKSTRLDPSNLQTCTSSEPTAGPH